MSRMTSAATALPSMLTRLSYSVSVYPTLPNAGLIHGKMSASLVGVGVVPAMDCMSQMAERVSSSLGAELEAIGRNVETERSATQTEGS